MKENRFNSHVIAGMSLLLLVATIIGCKKSFLNVPQQAQVPVAQFWNNATDAQKAVSALYANLRSYDNTAFPAVAVESMGSDDAEKGSSPNDASFMNQYDGFTVDPAEGQLLGFYRAQYGNINFANQNLDHIPSISMDETLKARYLAESKFIRAYSYFRLVRAFGDVPLRLALPKNSVTDYNIPRTPKAQVYAAMEQDLTDAASVLPQSYPATDIGRVTKGAALALRAKVALYQKKWNDVVTYTTQVMGLGYSLFPNYEKLFRVENENSSESIFELQCSIVAGNSGASNSQYSQVQGVRGSSGGGWGFNVPTQDLVNEFESGDPRRNATIIFRGTTTAEGDAIPATGDNPMYNYKSYVPFGMFVSGYPEGAQQNVRVLRYADVLLMNAEAANELGQTATALASLEMVRARARGSNAAILPKVTTTDQAALRTAVYHERRVEMAMEFDRYFDVIRQGRAATVFGPKGWKANKNEVWPVPQVEIDLSTGVLTQNPGY